MKNSDLAKLTLQFGRTIGTNLSTFLSTPDFSPINLRSIPLITITQSNNSHTQTLPPFPTDFFMLASPNLDPISPFPNSLVSDPTTLLTIKNALRSVIISSFSSFSNLPPLTYLNIHTPADLINALTHIIFQNFTFQDLLQTVIFQNNTLTLRQPFFPSPDQPLVTSTEVAALAYGTAVWNAISRDSLGAEIIARLTQSQQLAQKSYQTGVTIAIIIAVIIITLITGIWLKQIYTGHRSSEVVEQLTKKYPSEKIVKEGERKTDGPMLIVPLD